MKIGSLFSGGGLGDFGFLMAGFEIAWQVEIDEYCQKILALRYPESKKYRDIKILRGEELEPVDIITGGFPCQPFSVAGKQMGVADDRNLWPEMCRVISETNPAWVVCENVPGIIPIYLDTVYTDLEAIGYEVMPFVFSAHALGARHRRERLWIVAHTGRGSRGNGKRGSVGRNGAGEYETPKRSGETVKTSRPSEENGVMADATDTRAERMCGRKEPALEDVGNAKNGRLQKWLPEKTIQHNAECSSIPESIFASYWRQDPAEATTKSELGRVANGITKRVDRLKLLGNGQCPVNTFLIGKFIMKIETART